MQSQVELREQVENRSSGFLRSFSERAVKTGHARRIRDVDLVSSIETARSPVAYKGLAALRLLQTHHGDGLA